MFPYLKLSYISSTNGLDLGNWKGEIFFQHPTAKIQ